MADYVAYQNWSITVDETTPLKLPDEIKSLVQAGRNPTLRSVVIKISKFKNQEHDLHLNGTTYLRNQITTPSDIAISVNVNGIDSSVETLRGLSVELRDTGSGDYYTNKSYVNNTALKSLSLSFNNLALTENNTASLNLGSGFINSKSGVSIGRNQASVTWIIDFNNIKPDPKPDNPDPTPSPLPSEYQKVTDTVIIANASAYNIDSTGRALKNSWLSKPVDIYTNRYILTDKDIGPEHPQIKAAVDADVNNQYGHNPRKPVNLHILNGEPKTWGPIGAKINNISPYQYSDVYNDIGNIANPMSVSPLICPLRINENYEVESKNFGWHSYYTDFTDIEGKIIRDYIPIRYEYKDFDVSYDYTYDEWDPNAGELDDDGNPKGDWVPADGSAVATVKEKVWVNNRYIEVGFYETVKRQSDTVNLVINARDFSNYIIPLVYQEYYNSRNKSVNDKYGSSLKGGRPFRVVAFFNGNLANCSDDGAIILGDDIEYNPNDENEQNISISKNGYFSLNSNSSNIHEISYDRETVNYKFRFYNSTVLEADYNTLDPKPNLNEDNRIDIIQEDPANGGTPVEDLPCAYRWDLDYNVTLYCAPTENNINSRFSYTFKDINNNLVIASNLPNVILLNQNNIMVSDLYCANNDPEDGYCRAFRLSFREVGTNNKIFIRNVFPDFNDKDFAFEDGFCNGRVMEKNHWENKLHSAGLDNKLLELIIEPYFYFNDSPDTYYSQCEIVIPNKFIKISDEDLIPKLIFPVLSSTLPYTKIMLPEVERFGYEFHTVISDNWSGLKAKFGINIDGYDLFLNETKYFTNTTVVHHLLCNMGYFVQDYAKYKSALEIKPFIITMYNTPFEKRVYSEPNNSILDTTKENMWRIPIAQKGEYLTWYDYLNFEYFINKYKPLINNQIWTIQKDEMRGYIIKTDTWVDISNQLNSNYANQMLAWLENKITNLLPCWKETQFKHQKGEMITVESADATHDYLYEMKYTHNYLHSFTHNQISKMATTNNLKQNFYDLLLDLSRYL